MGSLMILSLTVLIQVLQLSSLEVPKKRFDLSALDFPKGFIFSSASASYQVEGGWNAGGKGENIWDRLVHSNPTVIKNHTNGDIACDAYNKYREDVNLMKSIGFKMYRFSLSWSRLFPKGFITQPNPDGVRYYNALIDELLANGIEPMVTIFHWDLPQPLQDIGGWLNPLIADVFGQYSRAVFQLFGRKVKWWITINEASSMAGGYGSAIFAPLLNLHNFGTYLANHNMLRAHAKAYRIYDKEFRSWQKGKVSFVLNGDFYIVNDPNSYADTHLFETVMQFTFGLYGHPIFSKEGDYPAIVKQILAKEGCFEGIDQSTCLPQFTKEEIEQLKGSSDFLALNHYTSNFIQNGEIVKNPKTGNVPKWEQSGCFWLQVVPEGFSGVLRWLKKEYNNPEIFVTENGYCGNEVIDNEAARINYFTRYLRELSKVIKEGSKIIGYTVWSLMDNFEWLDGFSLKFGIIKVDFKDPNRRRSFKDSAALFKQIIQKNL